MKHDWKDAPRPDRHPMGSECRRCAVCGAFQEMTGTYWWGRLQGEAWAPKVSRVCPGPLLCFDAKVDV